MIGQNMSRGEPARCNATSELCCSWLIVGDMFAALCGLAKGVSGVGWVVCGGGRGWGWCECGVWVGGDV